MAVLLLLGSFGLWNTRLTAPYIGSHDNNTAWIMLAAQNYYHYGAGSLGLVQYIDAERTTPTPQNVYHNHPPLASLWVAGAIAFWGESEASARLSVMLPSLLTAAAVFLLGRKLFSPLVGLIALGLFVTSPVIAFYGQMVAHEQFVIFFFTLALLVYIDLLKEPSRIGLIMLGILCGLITFSGWPGYFCVGVLGLHSLLFRPRSWIWLTIGISAVIASLAWMLPATLQGYGFLENLADRFLVRTGQTGVPWDSPLDYWWTMLWAQIRPSYSESLLLAMGFGGLLLLWRMRRTAESDPNLQVSRMHGVLIWLLILPQLLYMTIFSEAAFTHEYTVYYLALPAILMAAYFVVFLIQQAQEPRSTMRWGARGFLLLLVIGHLASSVRWTSTLYGQIDNLPVVAGAVVQAQVPEDVTVYANVGWWPAIWYYAEHNIRPMAEAATDEEAVYLRCNKKGNATPELSETQFVSDLWLCDLRLDAP